MTQNTQAGCSNTDLLTSIIGITVRNEEKISEKDRQFCQHQQDQLYALLNHLEQWYALFIANFDKYAEEYKLKMKPNGSIDEGYTSRSWDEKYRKYSDFVYLPFKNINKCVELAHQAMQAFASNIVNYFRNTYDINPGSPDINTDKIPWGFRPVYQTYVDHVISHLGGKDFKETAIDELIKRFHKAVVTGYKGKYRPELKNDKIVFPNLVLYGTYSLEKDNRIDYSHMSQFNDFCAGIYYAIFGFPNGNYTHISGFEYDNVDFSKTYNMIVNGNVTLKLFKNGRADVKFSDKSFAEKAFRDLRLETLPKPEDNE